MLSKILTSIQNTDFYVICCFSWRDRLLPFNDMRILIFFRNPALNFYCLLDDDSFNKYSIPRQLLLDQLEGHSIRIRLFFLIRNLLYWRSIFKSTQMTLPLKIFKMTYSQGIDLIKLYYFSIMTGVLHQAWHYVSWKRGTVSEERVAEAMFLVTVPVLALNPKISLTMVFSLYCSSMTKRKMSP